MRPFKWLAFCRLADDNAPDFGDGRLNARFAPEFY
jgi:hypothetical protein